MRPAPAASMGTLYVVSSASAVVALVAAAGAAAGERSSFQHAVALIDALFLLQLSIQPSTRQTSGHQLRRESILVGRKRDISHH